MSDSQHFYDGPISKLIVGLAGSVVSMKFVQGTWVERLLMCVGGAALSYYGTSPICTWWGVTSAEGLVGFLLGLFGMALVTRVYEAIQYFDVKRVMDSWSKRLSKLFGQ
jgi:hypothetical protein